MLSDRRRSSVEILRLNARLCHCPPQVAGKLEQLGDLRAYLHSRSSHPVCGTPFAFDRTNTNPASHGRRPSLAYRLAQA